MDIFIKPDVHVLCVCSWWFIAAPRNRIKIERLRWAKRRRDFEPGLFSVTVISEHFTGLIVGNKHRNTKSSVAVTFYIWTHSTWTVTCMVFVWQECRCKQRRGEHQNTGVAPVYWLASRNAGKTHQKGGIREAFNDEHHGHAGFPLWWRREGDH